MGLTALIGTLIAGSWSDRAGPAWPSFACFVIRLVSFVVILIDQSPVSVAIFALLFGITFLMTAPLTVMFMRQAFGDRNLGTITGVVIMVHHMCGGIAAWLGGAVFDTRGNYDVMMWASVGSSTIAALLSLALQRELSPAKAAATVMSATLQGIAAIVLWSTLASLTALAGAIPPFQLAAMTFAIGTVVGIAYARIAGQPLADLASIPAGALALGVFGLLGYHAPYFYALQVAPAIEANIINYLWPLLIVLFSGLLPARHGGKRLRWWHLAGAAIGFAGTLLAMLSSGATSELHRCRQRSSGGARGGRDLGCLLRRIQALPRRAEFERDRGERAHCGRGAADPPAGGDHGVACDACAMAAHSSPWDSARSGSRSTCGTTP